jgi:hypothetical protein
MLTSLPYRIFAGLHALENLELSGNRLNSLPEGPWKSVRDTQEGPFNGLTRLERIDLSNNQLHSISYTTFQGLYALKGIDLGRNRLDFISESAFAGLSNLTDLALSNNQLTSLPTMLFYGLTRMRYLTLDSNRLISIPNETLNFCPNLVEIFLGGNPGLLLFPLELPASSNSLSALKEANQFFSYRCKSKFAQFCQRAAAGGVAQAGKHAFFELPSRIRSGIFKLANMKECSCFDRCPLFENEEAFALVLKKYVGERFEHLSLVWQTEICARVRAQGNFAIWDQAHVFDNIFLLIDLIELAWE